MIIKITKKTVGQQKTRKVFHKDIEMNVTINGTNVSIGKGFNQGLLPLPILRSAPDDKELASNLECHKKFGIVQAFVNLEKRNGTVDGVVAVFGSWHSFVKTSGVLRQVDVDTVTLNRDDTLDSVIPGPSTTIIKKEKIKDNSPIIKRLLWGRKLLLLLLGLIIFVLVSPKKKISVDRNKQKGTHISSTARFFSVFTFFRKSVRPSVVRTSSEESDAVKRE